MTAKRALLDAEEASWQTIHALFHAIEGAAWESPPVSGAWSAKDLLAHLAAWHAEAECMLEAFTSTGELLPWPDADSFNAEAYERCRALPVDDVRAMAGAARTRFRDEARLLPDEITPEIGRIIVANGDGHYAEHLADLERFVEGLT